MKHDSPFAKLGALDQKLYQDAAPKPLVQEVKGVQEKVPQAKSQNAGKPANKKASKLASQTSGNPANQQTGKPACQNSRQQAFQLTSILAI